MTRTRTYGEGEIRIGTPIYLCDDIYSIGFVSQLRDDVMRKYLNITTGKLVNQEKEEDEVEDSLVNTPTKADRRKTPSDKDYGLEEELINEEYEQVVKDQEEMAI